MSSTRKYKKQVAEILAEGLSVIQVRSGHLKIINRDGCYLFSLALTSGDRRAWLNAVSGMRKLGLLRKEETCQK